MTELHVEFEHCATVEIDRYATSAGVVGFRARTGTTTVVAATPRAALRAIADSLDAEAKGYCGSSESSGSSEGPTS